MWGREKPEFQLCCCCLVWALLRVRDRSLYEFPTVCSTTVIRDESLFAKPSLLLGRLEWLPGPVALMLPALLFQTLSVSMLLRYSHHQIFVFIGKDSPEGFWVCRTRCCPQHAMPCVDSWSV